MDSGAPAPGAGGTVDAGSPDGAAYSRGDDPTNPALPLPEAGVSRSTDPGAAAVTGADTAEVREASSAQVAEAATSEATAEPIPLLIDDVSKIARRLLGSALTTRRLDVHGAPATVTLRITELEAYAGPDDPASHAYRGPNSRNAAMFGPPWHAYVYWHMGLHACMNIVVGEEGVPTGVLVRAGQVIDGGEVARARRLVKGTVRRETELASGPARLTAALGITTADTGAPLDGSTGILLTPAPPLPDESISAGPRVGVGSAREVHARFWITDDPTVSAYKAAPKPKRKR